MTDDGIEKRQHQRHLLQKKARIEVDGQVFDGQTSDISQGGVAIDAENTLNNDSFVMMHIEIIGDMTGRVVRNGNDKIAVMFDLVEKERLRLEAHLKSLFNEE